MSYELSTQESERRRFLLQGSIWKALFSVALPLVVYNSISQVFGVVDTLIAAHMSAQTVSTVTFISQIQSMFTATGAGLGIGGGVIISRYYGSGDMKKVEKTINTILFLAVGIVFILLALIIPFTVPFLRLLKMPEDLLENGTVYFMLETLGGAAVVINTIYFSIEKSRGNTRIVLYLNMLVIVIKSLLTILFIFIFHGGLLMLSMASVIAHVSLTTIAMFRLTRPVNPFRISIRLADFSRNTVFPIISLSLPIFLERFAFSFGKVTVNSMSCLYGSMAVGALGISNKISGLSTMPPNGFQEAEASLISQSLGNNNQQRALGFFKRTVLVNICIGLFFFTLMSVFMHPIISLFAHGDPAFASEISKMYRWERYVSILLAIESSIMGLLYGYGFTRTAMILNILRLFVFRIPPLWYMQNFTQLGSEGLGVAMFISNGAAGITASIVAFFLVKSLKKKHDAGVSYDLIP